MVLFRYNLLGTRNFLIHEFGEVFYFLLGLAEFVVFESPISQFSIGLIKPLLKFPHELILCISYQDVGMLS